MKKTLVCLLIVVFSSAAAAQTRNNRYEVEMLKNPNRGGKDTREVNAVLIFEKDELKVVSRRKNETFKEFRYSDVRTVEHSYSKNPFYTAATRAAILTLLTGLPLIYGENEKHWLTVVTEEDFVVLKIENDNFRLLKNEFLIRKLEVENVNENNQ